MKAGPSSGPSGKASRTLFGWKALPSKEWVTIRGSPAVLSVRIIWKASKHAGFGASYSRVSESGGLG